jgi:hypothetical protein
LLEEEIQKIGIVKNAIYENTESGMAKNFRVV